MITDKRSFDALDFNEVDNITVLKDAASAAIYGARSANGVILVTTKTGAAGKFQLNYNYSYSFEKPTKIPEYVGSADMVRLNNAARIYRGLPPIFDAEEVAYFQNNDPGLQWHDLTSQDPVNQKHSISASGGTDRIRYFVSGSYFDQIAAVKNVSYDKYNLRSNIDVNITKNIKSVIKMSYSQGHSSRFATLAGGTGGFNIDPELGSLWGRTLYYLPYAPAVTSGGLYVNPGWVGNLVAWINEGGKEDRVDRNVDMMIGLTYDLPFVQGLSVSGTFSPSFEGITERQWEIKNKLYNVNKRGSNNMIYTDEVTGFIMSSYPNKERLGKIYQGTLNYQLNFSANYVKTFGMHNINAIFVYEQSEGTMDYFYGYREGFPLLRKNQFWSTSAERADSFVDGSESETGRASYIGRLSYNYGEKYFANATIRRDGSMLFGPDFRWGTFPSVSAGWVITNEEFFNVEHIEFLKLRASWGLAGNDAVGGWKWSETFATSGSYLFGTAGQPRVTYGGIVNTQLTWEKTSEFNIGLDSRLLSGVIFSAEYFNRRNYDILDSRIVSLPNSFGGSMPPENYGEVKAYGYELELGYNGKAGQVDFMVKGNFGYANNKVVVKDVAQNIRDNDNPIDRPTDYVNMLVCTGMFRTQADLEALPAGYTIYGKPAELGGLRFEDISGIVDGVPDGKIDNYDRQVIKGKHYNAPYTYGLNSECKLEGNRFGYILPGSYRNFKIV